MDISISLIISMSAALGGGILKKYFLNGYSGNATARQTYNMAVSIVAAIILFCWGGMGPFSPFTILLGVVFGIITAVQQISNLKALECGPWSYTSVIISLSTLIPALSGALIWQETLQIPQIVGMVFLVVCFVFSVETKGEEKNASIKWLIWCAVAFLCTGFIGVMQKFHQSSDYKNELNAFLVTAFVVSCVYSFISVLIMANKKEQDEKTEKAKDNRFRFVFPIVLMVVSGICVAVNNKLNLYLSGVMDSAVFFPIVNGGGLVLTTIAASILFKEKLTKKQWIGLVVGICAVIFLANPFAG